MNKLSGIRSRPYMRLCVSQKNMWLTNTTMWNVSSRKRSLSSPPRNWLDLYPGMSAKEREYEIVKKYGAVFLMQIGDILSNGEKHDGRAPDYDDWKLNGDILVYYPVLDIALELSSLVSVSTRKACRAAEKSRLRRKSQTAIPESFTGRQTAADYRRRHRPVPHLHVSSCGRLTSVRFRFPYGRTRFMMRRLQEALRSCKGRDLFITKVLRSCKGRGLFIT